jgi:hypothetical protein
MALILAAFGRAGSLAPLMAWRERPRPRSHATIANDKDDANSVHAMTCAENGAPREEAA